MWIGDIYSESGVAIVGRVCGISVALVVPYGVCVWLKVPTLVIIFILHFIFIYSTLFLLPLCKRPWVRFSF
jgi:hypothetical protein